MKTILIGIILVGLETNFTAQTKAACETALNKSNSIGNCQLEYSDYGKRMVLHQSESISACNEIRLSSLPPITEPLTEIDLNLKSGNYTFLVNDSLTLPVSNYIYIEDQFTGATFKVEYGNSYTFVVKRAIPNRFKLYIAKASSAAVPKN